MLVKTRTQKHWFRSEVVILNTPLLSYGHFFCFCQVCILKIFKMFKYPFTYLRTFFEWKLAFLFESFKTVYKWLEKQFSPIRTEKGQVDTQKSKCFQIIYKLIGKTSLTYSHWETANAHPTCKVFSIHLQPAARKNAKQKSRYIGNRNKRGEKDSPRSYSVGSLCNSF